PTTAQQHEPIGIEHRTRAELNGVAIPDLDRDSRADGQERRDAGRGLHERSHAQREIGDADDVATHEAFVERARRRPLADRDVSIDTRAHEVV
ncbi:hypothetical protein C1Y03_30605, partial [Pseudomonas sp. FW306-02-H05-AA]